MNCESCFWDFYSNFDVSLSPYTEISIKEIKVRYAKFITSLGILKGAFDTI